MASGESFTRESDFDAEFPYILWDYYCDQVEAKEMTLDEAKILYLSDMAMADVRIDSV